MTKRYQYQESSSSTSDSITFRLEKGILNMLREEARLRQTSINNLASQIIGEHLNYSMNVPKAGLIPISKDTIRLLMDGLSEDDITRIARASASKVGDILMLLKGELTIDSALDVLESWLKTTNFGFTRSVDDERIRLVIRHEMGKKWSIYLSEYIRTSIDLLNKKIKLKISDNNIAFEIRLANA